MKLLERVFRGGHRRVLIGRGQDKARYGHPEVLPHLARFVSVPVEEPPSGLGRETKDVLYVTADELPAERRALQHVQAAEAVGRRDKKRQFVAQGKSRQRIVPKRSQVGLEQRNLLPRVQVETAVRPPADGPNGGLERGIEAVKAFQDSAIGVAGQSIAHQVEVRFNGLVLRPRFGPEPG